MRQKFLVTPFAAIGDRESPPDAQQPDGSVSYSQGFGPDYAADPAVSATAKLVPREETNGIYYDLTNALRALQTQGAPEFIHAADNGGTSFPYERGAIVRYSVSGDPPFTTYVSRVNNNDSALPTDATAWSPLVFETATNAQALAGSSSALIITPAALQYVLSQTAVSVPAATTTTAGTTRYATNAETVAGAVSTAAVTPSALVPAVATLVPAATETVAGRVRSSTPAEFAAGTAGYTFVPTDRIRAALNLKQDALNYTPVRQGGGSGQLTNTLYLGWTGSGVSVQVDSTNLGAIMFQSGLASALAPYALLSGAAFTGAITAPSVQTGLARIAGSGGALLVDDRTDSSASAQWYAQVSGGSWQFGRGAQGVLVSFTSSGAVIATGGFQGSSRTVKRDVRDVPASEAAAIVQALPSVTFAYRPEYRDDGDRRSFGFIAEDLRALVPEAVRETPDGASPLVVEHAQLTAVLWAALQDAFRRIETLENRDNG